MTNEMNKLFEEMAKIATKKIEKLQDEFCKAADKIMTDMQNALNEAEAKEAEEKKSECTAGDCLHCCDDLPETVILNEEEFCKDEEPCEIVSIYAKHLNDVPCVLVEYDKTLKASGALTAVIDALAQLIYASFEEADISCDIDSVRKVVYDRVPEMIVAAALSDITDNIFK